jgi:hypothetical protein
MVPKWRCRLSAIAIALIFGACFAGYPGWPSENTAPNTGPTRIEIEKGVFLDLVYVHGGSFVRGLDCPDEIDGNWYLARTRLGQLTLLSVLVVFVAVFVHAAYKRFWTRQRFQYSLGALIASVAIAALGLWGGCYWYQTESALQHAKDEREKSLSRFLLSGAGNSGEPAIYVRPFRMANAEITQEQFDAVMGYNPATFRGGKNPVESILIEEALQFCGRLSTKAGITVRLPTEDEWEFACRAGSDWLYYIGDTKKELSAVAWWAENSNGVTHPVCHKQPNANGIFDLLGNVWEVCLDRGGIAVPRGGSYCDADARSVTVFSRNNWTDDLKADNIGFRIVAEIAAGQIGQDQRPTRPPTAPK